MYQKMQVSGLTEIIPFICVSAVWDQWPALYPWLAALCREGQMGQATTFSCAPSRSPTTSCSALTEGERGMASGCGQMTLFFRVSEIYIWKAEIADGCDILV